MSVEIPPRVSSIGNQPFRSPVDESGAITGTHWRDYALCAEVGADIWFPSPGGSCVEAKRICGECPVQPECLDYALTRPETDGIWGGMTPNERHSLQRPVARKVAVFEPYTRKQPTHAPNCGTEAGAKAHYRRDEKRCAACDRALRLARATRRGRHR